MGQYTQAVQQLYVAYFNRPADPSGLTYWENVAAATGGNLTGISAAFASSTEYTSLFTGMNSDQIVNKIYNNLFGREAEIGGLAYWSDKLAAGQLTVSNIVTTVAAGALTTDLDAFNSKVTAATSFTAALDTTGERLAYNGSKALALAKAYITGVTDATTLATATAGLDATIATVVNVQTQIDNPPQTFTLTSGIDGFTGLAGNDVFVANATTAQTFTAFDKLDGGAGTDSFTLVSATGANVALPSNAGTSVKNIEIATLSGDKMISGDVSGWTGLTELTVGTVGGATLTAATTTAVTHTDSGLAAGDITVNGGSNVSVTSTGANDDGNITVGTTVAPTGTVTISSTSGAGNSVTMPSIKVAGGTVVNITQAHAHAVNTTQTNGTVEVTGGAATTKVTVSNTAAATASATVAGVNVNSVTVKDVNYASTTKAGSITSVSIDGYSTVGVGANSLTSLTVANGAGNIIIDNSGLTTPTNKTLAVSVNNLKGGTLDDADIYTTLNVTATGANSTLANVTFGATTALTVAGTKGLTLTSTAGLTKLATVTVSGSAGITADLSAATVTTIDASATSGANKVTIDASKALFTGGSGADTVTTTAATVSKAITLGAGDDSLTLGGAAAPTAAIGGGAGTDSISMGAALAATASGSSSFAGLVTGFERLVLTGATNQTIDLDVLGKFNHVTTSGGNGLTLSNLPTGGTLNLTGAGTAYTIGNSAFTAGTADVVNLGLTDGSGAAVAFASTGITASGVETFAITVTDSQAEPTGTFNDSVTLLGNSVKTITVSGNAGLTLTAASTALTSVDASGIAGVTTGGFSWTSGALAAASVVKGSAVGANTVDVSAATAAVTYTGGTGVDAITASNGKNNTFTLGDGANTLTGTSGNNTVTGGKDADTVTFTTGNNTVNLGNGANAFTATTGNNTYTGGTGVDTVTVGGGSNVITLGTGADVVSITAAGANVNTYTEIKDAHAGVSITFTNQGTETFNATKVSLANTAVFQDYANAVIQAGGDAGTNGAFGWFTFGGDTYLVQSRHNGSGNTSFVNGTDMVIKLTGIVDLSTATGTGTATLTLV